MSVGIGDAIQFYSVVKRHCNTVVDAPRHWKELRWELKLFISAYKSVLAFFEKHKDDINQENANLVFDSCNKLQADLKRLLYPKPIERRRRDIFSFSAEKVEGWKDKIQAQKANLLLLRGMFNDACAAETRDMVRLLVSREFRKMKTASSTSVCTIDSLSTNSTEIWRDIRRSLKDRGISSEILGQYKDQILSEVESIVSGHTERQREADIPASDTPAIETRLLEAAGEGDWNKVYRLLQNNPEINTQLPGPRLLFSNAIYHKQWEIVEALVEMGADPNGKSVDSRPAITAAAASGAWSTVRLLSTQGADLEVRDEENHTVLLRAFCCQSWDTVVSLLTSGANYRATTGEPSHITATSYAAENREWIQAELFVKAGADCNSRDTDGNPILVVAARARCWSMMRTLVKRGADVNAEDRNGKRALAYVLSEVKALLRVETDYASGEWQNVLDVVTLLLGKGATIGMKEAMTLSGGTNGQAVLEKFLNEYPQNMADDLKTPSKSSPEQVGSTLSPSPVTIRPPVRRKDHPAFRPPKEAFPARDKDSIDPGPSSGVPMPC